MFDSLTNRAKFFSDHYLNARLATDLTIREPALADHRWASLN